MNIIISFHQVLVPDWTKNSFTFAGIFKRDFMRVLLLFLIGCFFNLPSKGNEKNGMSYESIHWSVYSELPFSGDKIKQPGLSGTFAGLINNRIVIAGGANYSDALSRKGGKIKYYSDVYLLSADDPKDWTVLPEALPANIAFGVSITLPDGLLIIGGSNEEGCRKDVILLTIQGVSNEIKIIEWPSLPVPLTNMTGTIVGNNIYIAGGQEEMTNPRSASHFFVIDSKNKNAGWKSLGSWPGPPRSFAVSAAQNNGFDNCFYLFSGINCNTGLPVEFLYDGYEYNPRLNTWKKIDELPSPQFPVIGGTAFPSGVNHIIFVGGISDNSFNELSACRDKQVRLSGEGSDKSSEDSIRTFNDQIINSIKYPDEINTNVLFYHTVTNTLVKRGGVDFPVLLTANVIKSRNRLFIPGWDYKPGKNITNIIEGKIILRKTGIGIWNIVIMSLYFGLLAWMGWYFSRRQKNTTDYFKAGGKMSWWLVALSIYGTSLSSITYMAIPAKAYATDWSYMVYNFGVITAIPVIVILFIPFYRKLNITTAYEYLEMRFNVAVRVLASIAFMIFQIGRMAIVLFLPSIAINIITGFDIFLCIALMGVISLIYTAMGGIEAVIWTDAIQIFILFGGAILTLIFISTGLENGFFGIISTGSEYGKFHMAEARIDFRAPTLLTALIATFFASLTTYGTDQTMVQRYMTTTTQKMAEKSLWAKVLIAIPGGLLFFFIGTALFVFYKTEPSNLSFTISDGDAIFPWFIFTQMPAILSGLLLSGILAAAMSTVSASMNSAATAYSVDIHFRFGWMKNVNQLIVARLASVFFGLAGTLLALMMATWEIVSLWDQFIEILGLLIGSFGGLFLLGIITKRANGAGALIGIITSVLIQIWIDQNHIVHGLLYVATGSLTCFIVGYIASLFFPKSKKEITNLTV